MENETDFFHCLPDEVTQLIFSRIRDYKTLIQCMSVSKSFRQQAVRVPSLSIVCPINFSSYDERLQRVFAMVKAFRSLKSLVVRVGQPRDERPSWARCMRYAEMGVTVEKFIFMAAKRGDFSQLDATLLGVESLHEKPQGDSSSGFNSSGTLWRSSVHADVDSKNVFERTRSFDRTSKSLGVVDRKDKGIYRGLSEGIMKAGSNPMQQGRFSIPSLDTSIKMKPLSQLNLHQVIAPSNDVLKRMLPVIHFAIVQGLNELRDSLPGFVAQFTELRAFLLVDIVESITVFMREHHIQELRSSYLELNELPDSVEGASQADLHVCDNIIGGKVLKEKKVEEHLCSRRQSGKHDVLDLRYINGKQRREDGLSGCENIGKHDNSSSMKNNWRECSPSNIISASDFRALDTKSSQTLNGKKKTAVEFGSEVACRLPVCNPVPRHLVRDNCNNLNNDTGYGEDDWGSECLHGLSGLGSVHTNLFKNKNMSASCAGLEALNVTKSDTPTWPETMTECPYIVDSNLDHQGDDYNNVIGNDYRTQGNRGWRNSKAESAGQCSLRKLFKPDNRKKKDFKALHLSTSLQGTDGLHCSRFLEENRDVKGSEMHVCNYDEKQCSSHEMPQEHGNDNKSSISSVEIGDDEILSGYVDDCASSRNKLGATVEGIEGNELQSSNSMPLSSQACQYKTPKIGGGRLAHGDFWQEQVQRQSNSLNVDSSLEFSQNLHSHQTQTVELIAPEVVEGSARADHWRHVWQERMRRLRDSLPLSSGQEPNQTPEGQREELNDCFRKRDNSVEKDSLSFDYTFWRAEQVSSCDCVVSDVSMCVATHSAQPLKDFEKEVLTQAAIAGPLLVAAISHVNNHHASHQL